MRRHLVGPGALTFFGVLAISATARAGVVAVSSPAELRAAISAAKPGDEIVLAAGTYAMGPANVDCKANGTVAAPIVVRSATPLAAKVEITSLEGFVVTGASWHFEGLDIKGTCATDSACAHAFHVSGAAVDFVMRKNRIVDFNAQLKANAGGSLATIPHRGVVEDNEIFDTHARQTDQPVNKVNIDTGDGWVVRGNFIHDFQSASGAVSYGAFMKSGGKNGLFERNLVICRRDLPADGVTIALSFGGGLTGNQFCAPAFSAAVACQVEHENGMMKNNVVARCADVGIAVNKGKGTRLLYNTLIATTGIDLRFDSTTAEVRGNVIGGKIRDRDGSTHVESDNVVELSQAAFEAMYMAPLAGDLRKKGALTVLLGKGPVNADVPADYCLRARTAAWDLGALQHSLGDCATVPPPSSVGSPGADGGATSPGDGGTTTPPGADGGTSGDGGPNDPSASPNEDPDASDGGCACHAAPRSGAPLERLALVVASVAAALAWTRRRRASNDR